MGGGLVMQPLRSCSLAGIGASIDTVSSGGRRRTHDAVWPTLPCCHPSALLHMRAPAFLTHVCSKTGVTRPAVLDAARFTLGGSAAIARRMGAWLSFAPRELDFTVRAALVPMNRESDPEGARAWTAARDAVARVWPMHRVRACARGQRSALGDVRRP